MRSAPVVIRGGAVVDGTGAPPERRDVAAVDGRLVDPDDVPSNASTLDADGCVVAPGFIDIHTHFDAQVFWDPALSPSCYHGVTTVVAGNCGFSIAPTRPEMRDVVLRTLETVEDMSFETMSAGVPWEFESFAEYLGAVARRRPGLNFGAFVGHTPLRLYVMGRAAYERAATADEITAMRRGLAEALRAGAVGFATSSAITHLGMDRMPVPSRLAERDEVTALMEEVGAWGRGVIQVTAGDPATIAELYTRQPELGVPITYGGIVAEPALGHHAKLDAHRSGVAAGADVWPQVTPRPVTFAFRMDDPFTLNFASAFAELAPLPMAERQACYRDPEWRERARRSIDDLDVMKPRLEAYSLAGTGDGPGDDTPLSVVAEQRGVSLLDALLDAAADAPTVWVRAVLLNDDPVEVADLLRAEHCTFGLSDAGAHVSQLCDAPQATDLLGTWVRERGVLSLEEAVRRLTSAQADLFGFAGRGRLRAGHAADVVVFDPDTVAPGPIESVRDFPARGLRLTARSPAGVRHVLVNGVPIRVDEVQLDADDAGPGTMVSPAPRA